MKYNQNFFKNNQSTEKIIDFNSDLNIANTIMQWKSTGSGRGYWNIVDYGSGGDSSGPIIIGASLGVFTIVILMILLIKKNNSSGSVKSDSDNKRSSLNEQISDTSLTDLLEKLKKSYFPKLSIAESFIKGNYVILKDLSGNIISESNIMGNYVIVNDINGEVISEVKFKK